MLERCRLKPFFISDGQIRIRTQATKKMIDFPVRALKQKQSLASENLNIQHLAAQNSEALPRDGTKNRHEFQAWGPRTARFNAFLEDSARHNLLGNDTDSPGQQGQQHEQE